MAQEVMPSGAKGKLAKCSIISCPRKGLLSRATSLAMLAKPAIATEISPKLQRLKELLGE